MTRRPGDPLAGDPPAGSGLDGGTGPDERVAPEVALATPLTDPRDPAGPPRRVKAGVPADLVLLSAGLAAALDAAVRGDSRPVRAVFIRGVPAFPPAASAHSG